MPKLKTSKGLSKAKNIVRREIRSAMRDVGAYIINQGARYPQKTASIFYKRTGTLGRSITKEEPKRTGNVYIMRLGTNVPYARYVEEGTGLYGPKKQKIKPKTAKALAWRISGGMKRKAGNLSLPTLMVASGVSYRGGKARRARSKDMYLVFARSVKGMKPWYFMRNAMTSTKTKQYQQKRYTQMVKRIAISLGD